MGRFPDSPCPGCGKLFELGDDAVAGRRLDNGQWLPDAWHRTCLNAHAEATGGWFAGPKFDVGASDDLAIAWVGTATGKGASENLDEKLREALEKSRGQWTAVAVEIENGRIRDITAEVIGPTAPQLEAALRYLWNAWAEAEGDGQPRGWVFGPGAELDEHMLECGEALRPRATPEVQETIRRVLGAEPSWASSMAQLAEVGGELFGRLQQIAKDIVPDGTWADQPQHVRDAICILFAMVRNRTTDAGMRGPK